MSVQNFIPTMWQSELLESFKSQAIINNITYPVPTVGGKLVINKMGSVAVKDYQGTVTYDELSTDKVEVPFDQKKFFAIKISDIDAVQVAGELRAPAVREGAYQLAKAVDEHAVDKILKSQAHSTVLKLDKTNAYDAIVDANRALDKKDIPADRVIVCGWDTIALLEKSSMKESFHQNVQADGIAYRLNGVPVLPTNRVPEGTVLVLNKSAVAYGMQLEEMEALRLQESFSDAIRALEVFAVEVVRPEAIEIIKAK